MATTNYEWDGKLQPNLLTKEVNNDYIFVVNPKRKTFRNADIAQAFKDAGSELQYETILNVLDRADALRRQKVQEGYSVLTGTCHLQPRVTGTWIGATAKFDPAVHKVTCTLTPSAELRKALAEVRVTPMGIKDSGAYIGLVTDTLTGATDGTITPNEDICIEGDKIKIAPADEAGLGVFFVAPDGAETPVTRRLTQNDPKKVIARVPALAAGTYTLIIKTRFTSGDVPLKEPRTLTYHTPLTLTA